MSMTSHRVLKIGLINGVFCAFAESFDLFVTHCGCVCELWFYNMFASCFRAQVMVWRIHGCDEESYSSEMDDNDNEPHDASCLCHACRHKVWFFDRSFMTVKAYELRM